ncbi:MAG: Hpt domain-containing protein [Lachnospiraceae bacterium]|nr:Hpt domain-containing protein [Lachnospiraceae bacterium]
MTVKECYDLMGGNYDEAKQRLMDDKRILKFLGMFMRDTSFQEITAALENQDYAEAFKGAHSLKGVSRNMAFDALGDAADALTENLRNGSSTADTTALYEKTKTAYELVVQTIEALQASQA